MMKPRQLKLDLRTWGGKRRRAGRKPKGARALVPHRPREAPTPRFPVHATLHVRQQVWNLRSRRCFRALERAFRGGRERFGFRLVHFSVMGNHVHLLVEAPDNVALARGMQGLAIRMAKALNRVMGRRGSVFADHYHSRVLRSPREVARALDYVLRNFAHHAARRGEFVPLDEVDPFSSAPALVDSLRAAGLRRVEVTLDSGPPVVAPGTWLLRIGWMRGI